VAKLYAALFKQLYDLQAGLSQGDFMVLQELQGADEPQAQGLDLLKITKQNADIKQVLDRSPDMSLAALLDVMAHQTRDR
jgi:hypothetical protein